MQTTFTLLVTIDHDANQGTSPSRIAEIVQCALEEGTSQSGSFHSATVDAFKGVRLTERTLTGDDLNRYKRILPLHK